MREPPRSSQRFQLAVIRCQQLHFRILEVSRESQLVASHAKSVAYMETIGFVCPIYNHDLNCNNSREGSKKS